MQLKIERWDVKKTQGNSQMGITTAPKTNSGLNAQMQPQNEQWLTQIKQQLEPDVWAKTPRAKQLELIQTVEQWCERVKQQQREVLHGVVIRKERREKAQRVKNLKFETMITTALTIVTVAAITAVDDAFVRLMFGGLFALGAGISVADLVSRIRSEFKKDPTVIKPEQLEEYCQQKAIKPDKGLPPPSTPTVLENPEDQWLFDHTQRIQEISVLLEKNKKSLFLDDQDLIAYLADAMKGLSARQEHAVEKAWEDLDAEQQSYEHWTRFSLKNWIHDVVNQCALEQFKKNKSEADSTATAPL